MALAPFDRRGRYGARVRSPPLPFLPGRRDPVSHPFHSPLAGVNFNGLRRGAIYPPYRDDRLRDPALLALQNHPLNRRAYGGYSHNVPYSSALSLLSQYPPPRRAGQLDSERERDRYRNRCDCDACYRKGLLPSNSCHHGHESHCPCGDHNCNSNKSNNYNNYNNNGSTCSSQKFDFKTKDITIRGKARSVRSSYLTEAPKFEFDLLKYLDKKTEDLVPDRVIEMLIDYINSEGYSNSSHIDEITLNILAFNVGAKSVVDYSLGRLRKHDGEVRPEELSCIVGTVLLSLKVDTGLKEWLKKYLQNEDRFYRLQESIHWRNLIEMRPEIWTETMRLLGKLPEAGDEGYKAL